MDLRGGVTKTGSRTVVRCALAVCILAVLPERLRADAFSGYQLAEMFSLPAGAGPFDLLADGRIVTLVNSDVYAESTRGSRVFALQGTLPGANIASFGAAFIRVSPNGAKLAVGDNVDKVGVFSVDTLSGAWFTTPHFEAEWYDNAHLAISSSGQVTLLDTDSPDVLRPINPPVVVNVGGAPAGVTFDPAGNLYTGNGFQYAGPSGTGTIKAFPYPAWSAALVGGPAVNFETGGVLVADLLSASPLAFDRQDNLLVGGGDFIGGTDIDFAALVRASAVARALGGGGPADSANPNEVRRLDPDASTALDFYYVNANPVTHELYLRNFGDDHVFVYVDTTGIPTITQWGAVAMTIIILTCGTLIVRNRPGTVYIALTSMSHSISNADEVHRGGAGA